MWHCLACPVDKLPVFGPPLAVALHRARTTGRSALIGRMANAFVDGHQQTVEGLTWW